MPPQPDCSLELFPYRYLLREIRKIPRQLRVAVDIGRKHGVPMAAGDHAAMHLDPRPIEEPQAIAPERDLSCRPRFESRGSTRPKPIGSSCRAGALLVFCRPERAKQSAPFPIKRANWSAPFRPVPAPPLIRPAAAWGTRGSRKPGAGAGFRGEKVGLGADFLGRKPGVGAGFLGKGDGLGAAWGSAPARCERWGACRGRVVQRSSLSVRVRRHVVHRSPLSRSRDRGRGGGLSNFWP